MNNASPSLPNLMHDYIHDILLLYAPVLEDELAQG